MEKDIIKSKEGVALWIQPKNVIGALRDIFGKIAEYNGNITYIEQFERTNRMWLYVEVEGVKNLEVLINELKKLDVVISIEKVPTFSQIFGKRVIIIGGGAQVAMAASGAIIEADRHNLRGERVSVDTMPIVGEKEIADAVRAVAKLPRVKILVLAGALMGGEISEAVEEVKKYGIKVISLSMAGSVPEHADLVVTDPTEAGVLAVMDVASTAKFSIDKLKERRI